MEHPVNILEPEEQKEVSIGDLIYKYINYWPLFLLLLVVMLTGAWIYLRYTRPVYETTAKLLIKDDNNAPGDQMLEAFNLFGPKKSVENEVEILQSNTLMKQVVRNLQLYAPLRVEGRVTSQSAYVYSPIKIMAPDPDSIKDVSKVYFKYDENTHQVIIGDHKYPLDKYVFTPYGTLQFLKNFHYKKSKLQDPEENDQFYFSLQKVKSVANSLVKGISVSPSSEQSTVIELSIKDEVRERGEDILNELLKVYNHAAVLDKNALAGNTLKFVEDRLKLVVHDLDSIESTLQHFKARNKITDISAQGQIFLQTVATNDQKISDINMQLAVLDQVEGYIRGDGGLGGIAPATLGVSDPNLTAQLGKLADLELQYTQTKNIVPDNNPALIALKDGINKLKPGILENVISQKKNLIAARNDLEGTNSQYSSMLRTIPEKERELLGISRQQSIKNDIYTFLLKKREETALSLASVVADSRIIDQAESSDEPVSPKKNLIYLAAALLALVLGAVYIFLKDAFTRTVQSRKDIEANTSVPILGELVFHTSKSPIVIKDGQRSFIAEQFRQLRTSLAYMGIDENHKRILITSSISGEGKSFVSINLGISLSLTGKKVILLELDLRKPKLSKQMGIPSREGISNFLIGKVPYTAIIKETGFENLAIAPSGPIPPNPSELISNGKLNELFRQLESEFDYLIIDAPPVNPVTDATILSPRCNITLFIIRHEYTPKEFVTNIEQKKNSGSIKNPAIVLNGIKIKSMRRYSYGKANKYGYGYGYGYSEDAKESKKWWQRIF